MDLEERFRYIMKLNNLSASAFADEIGVQRSSISHILSGRNKPSLEFIQKVLNRFPKVDAAWLINGTTSINREMDVPNESQVETEKDKTIIREELIEDSPLISYSKSQKPNIKRILVFYEDQSFEEFTPRS